MATSTDVQKLEINVLTQAQYDAATKNENALYLVIDATAPIETTVTDSDTLEFYDASVAQQKSITVANFRAAISTNYVDITGDQMSGALTVPTLHVLKQTTSSDEGGQITLARPTTNTTFVGDMVVDFYMDQFRIFDGAGSGKGAYINLANAGAGVTSKVYTSADKPTPNDLGTWGIIDAPVIPDGTDLNTYLTPGSYRINAGSNAATMTNIPYTTTGGRLIVTLIGNSSSIRQIYMTNTSYTYTYERYYSGGTWYSWQQDYNAGNKPSAADVGALSTSAGGTVNGAVYITYPNAIYARHINGASTTNNDLYLQYAYQSNAIYSYGTLAHTGTINVSDNITINNNSGLCLKQVNGTPRAGVVIGADDTEYFGDGAINTVIRGSNIYLANTSTVNATMTLNSVSIRKGAASTWVGAATSTGNQSVINSTGAAGSFQPIFAGQTTNGAMVCAIYQDGFHVQYVTAANIASQTNTSSNIFRATESGYLYATRVYGAYYNDYAEYFEKNEEAEAGDIICVDELSGYKKCVEPYCKTVIGVVSDTYFQCIGGKDDGQDEENYYPIGLAGRVKVKVMGDIKKGDLIVSSPIPGVGMASGTYTPGTVIGKALEEHNGSSIDRITMLIMNV